MGKKKKQINVKDLKVFCQFFKTRQRGVVAVSCTVYDGKQVARGLAVCSPDDTPDTDIGMAKAKHHALRALLGRGEERVTDKRAVYELILCGCPYSFHSELSPDLSWLERKKLFGAKGMWDLPKDVEPGPWDYRSDRGRIYFIRDLRGSWADVTFDTFHLRKIGKISCTGS